MQEIITSFSQLEEKLREKGVKLNFARLKKTFEYAANSISQQTTPTGRLFKEHLLNTAKIMAKLSPDEEMITAVLLHHADCKDDSERKEIEKLFGKDIVELIDEQQKSRVVEEANLDRVDWGLLSTIMLASAKDIRTIFIKIASTIDRFMAEEFVNETEAKQKAMIALNVYAPLCHKLGINEFEWMLEDLAFKQLYRVEFNRIKDLLGAKRVTREKDAKELGEELEKLMKKHGLDTIVLARAKHFYSIFKKMKRKPFNEIYDLQGARIICNSVEDCYKALGTINSNYQTIEHKFRDYIADAKDNKYKSIHTVIIKNRAPAEVQIRTWQMHWDDEVGLAAHWQYKGNRKDKYFDRKLTMVKQLMDWHKTHKESSALRQSLKARSGEERIFVFTPKRQVIILRENSTPIDFAYAIHSDIGCRAKGTKVNGKAVGLNHVLENSDTIEIITGPKKQVKRQWLNFVKTEKAKSKIKQALGIREHTSRKKKPRIVEKTTSDLSIRMAKCCKPLPGDEIIGYKTTKRKISVHRKSCPGIKGVDKAKVITVEWLGAEKNYETALAIEAKDNAALFPELLKIFSENRIKIDSTNAKTNKNSITSCLFNVRIQKKGQLDKAIEKISALPYVLNVERK